MDHKDKDNKPEVLDHVESFKKEEVKSYLSECLGAEDESVVDKAIPAKSPSSTLRKCDICGKTFNSGKALGGHRRSHFQKHQKKVKVRFTSKAGDGRSRANCDYNDDDDGKFICSICKKEFPTKNSLFGHMRSHPERSWRGVSPPTHSRKHSSSSPSSSYSFPSLNSDSMGKSKEVEYDDDDDGCVGGGNRVFAPNGNHTNAVDLSIFTSPSWLKKDVRGRKCIGGYEAAETLAQLSAYSWCFCGGSTRVFPKKDEVLPMSVQPLIKHAKRKMGEASCSKKHEVKKIKFYLKGELKVGNKSDWTGECGDDEGDQNRSKGLSESGVERVSYMDDDDVNAEIITRPAEVHVHVAERKKNDQRNSKKLVLKSRVKDTEFENRTQEKVGGYKCGACGKVFTTFQGLGGHRSIHKEKNIPTIMDESNLSQPVAEENNSSSSSNMHKVEKAAITNEATLPPAADEGYQSSGTTQLDFDLNELPCVMED